MYEIHEPHNNVEAPEPGHSSRDYEEIPEPMEQWSIEDFEDLVPARCQGG